MSEVLARLTPAAIDIEHIAGGFAALTSSDIAYCLAGLSDLHQRYAMHSYVYAETDYDICPAAKADRYILSLLLSRLLQNEMNVTTDRANKLTLMQMHCIQDGQVCTKCHGHKVYLDVSGHKHKCAACNETGYNRRSASELCRIAGIDRSNWKRRNYEEDYAESCKIVTQIKQTINAHIRRVLQ